ncbi:hypothetical protein KP509_22G053700 [Ceratopteris richardii]|uniref:Uncharacterized protein n=1 Tax=Ceratopteris richardii TaxID=49495 RepID=A0A8T2S7Z3_CERRI|nr:hypothetical protein KP509_22G053700 [Ceratopteris richardii]
MEPRRFARLSVAAVALRFFPSCPSFDAGNILCPSSTLIPAKCAYTCTIQLYDLEAQTISVPLWPLGSKAEPDSSQVSASFYLDEPAMAKLVPLPRIAKKSHLRILLYESIPDASTCISCWGPNAVSVRSRRKCIGKLNVPVSSDMANLKTGLQIHQGWASVGHYKSCKVEFHFTARVDLDPRYILQFDAEPELSPQIVHIQGSIRQPIFTCKFTRGRSRGDALDRGHGVLRDWEGGHKFARDRDKKPRKGWLLLIYDLSGSPVAAASMITPFVPSLGSDIVSRANPGAWLIMRAGPCGGGSWKPWGKLEAWREKGPKKGLGCRFQLMGEGCGMASFNKYDILVSETIINSRKGGSFFIDSGRFKPETPISASPVDSPHSSGDFCFNLGGPLVDCGFVMSANVHGERRPAKPPSVQLAMRHISCIEDAAVFMALAAAVDLSMYACLPFSKKLGKNFEENDDP